MVRYISRILPSALMQSCCHCRHIMLTIDELCSPFRVEINTNVIVISQKSYFKPVYCHNGLRVRKGLLIGKREAENCFSGGVVEVVYIIDLRLYLLYVLLM